MLFVLFGELSWVVNKNDDGLVVSYLEGAAEGAGRALGGVGAEPGGVAPDEAAVGAGVDLAAADGELDVPHVG